MTEHDRRHIYERRRNILFLISQYLGDLSLEKTQKSLKEEAHLNQTEFQICDNVDLETIYLEFCTYYQIKFGKKPRFVKRVESETSQPNNQQPAPATLPNIVPNKDVPRASTAKKRNTMKASSICSFTVLGRNCSPSPDIIQQHKELELSLHSTISNSSIGTVNKIPVSFEGTYMKPTADFYDQHPSDWKDMIDLICREIIKKDLCVKWEHVCGSDIAKLALQESVIMPLECPHLFTDIKPWRAVLLHGVSGTGKTLLARALCSSTHHKVTFFNVCSSTMISKWRGESEKLIRILFEVAKYYSPSVVFIDELDSLTSKRDALSEHEASKRFKNEFLSLLDGIDNESSGIFILGSTNLPWEIDTAFLRRFERKILVDVPDFEARIQLIKQYLPCSVGWSESEIADIAEMTDNYTGDDIRVAVKEANMMEIRKRFAAGIELKSSDILVEAWQLKESLKSVKPNPIQDILKHRQFNKSFGNS